MVSPEKSCITKLFDFKYYHILPQMHACGEKPSHERQGEIWHFLSVCKKRGKEEEGTVSWNVDEK